MRYKKYLKKANKMFDMKLLMIAFVMALTISIVAVNGANLQSQFLVGENVAEFKLAGLSYGGQKFLSESAFKNGHPAAQVFEWRSEKISTDVDGDIKWSGPVYGSRTLDQFSGLKPDVSFELTKTPYLVDLDGNALSRGYTDILTRADGATQYMYYYKTQLKIRTDMGIIDMAECRKQGIVPPYLSQKSSGQWFYLYYDGADRPMAAMGEFGIIRNLNALLQVRLPNVEGYTLGWELHVDATSADMIFSKDGTVYNEFNYQPVFDEYPEGDISILVGDGQYHVNMNDNIQRTNSIGEKLVPVEIGGKEVVSVGLTQTLVPAIVRTEAVWFFIFSQDSVTRIHRFTPIITYDLIIKVAVVNAEIDSGDSTEPITTPPTTPPVDWDPIVSGMELYQAGLLGGGVFFGVVVIGFILKRRREAIY